MNTKLLALKGKLIALAGTLAVIASQLAGNQPQVKTFLVAVGVPATWIVPIMTCIIGFPAFYRTYLTVPHTVEPAQTNVPLPQQASGTHFVLDPNSDDVELKN